MSAPERAPEPRPVTTPAPEPVAEPEVLRSPAWPASWTTSALLLSGLAAALLIPALSAGAEALALIVLAPAAFAAAVCGRILFEAFEPSRVSRAAARVPAACGAALFATALAAAAAALVGSPLSALGVAVTLPVAVGLLLVAAATRRLEIRLRMSSRRVFFVGGDGAFEDLGREVARRGDLRVAGRLGLEPAGRTAAELVDTVLAARPTVLVMSGEAIRREPLVGMASELNLRGLRVRTLDDYYEREFSKVPLSELSPSWFLFDVAEIHDARAYGVVKRVVKRVLESVIAAAVLVVCTPLLPLIALMIRLSGPGPILFRQKRVGRDGEIFTLTKFRTMRAGDDVAGWATEHAARITPVGRLLRRFRADELPQLWHVVRGHMSLVGPRPEQPEIVERLSRDIEFYSARHHVRPGLTGWAQVNHGYGGSLGATLEKLQYEFFYIKHQSLRLDLRILGATIHTVLSGRGS
jgi:exopolysaccharide biosynthesis polyprenyl glycosylphosphotransferase